MQRIYLQIETMTNTMQMFHLITSVSNAPDVSQQKKLQHKLSSMLPLPVRQDIILSGSLELITTLPFYNIFSLSLKLSKHFSDQTILTTPYEGCSEAQ